MLGGDEGVDEGEPESRFATRLDHRDKVGMRVCMRWVGIMLALSTSGQ